MTCVPFPVEGAQHSKSAPVTWIPALPHALCELGGITCPSDVFLNLGVRVGKEDSWVRRSPSWASCPMLVRISLNLQWEWWWVTERMYVCATVYCSEALPRSEREGEVTGCSVDSNKTKSLTGLHSLYYFLCCLSLISLSVAAWVWAGGEDKPLPSKDRLNPGPHLITGMCNLPATNGLEIEEDNRWLRLEIASRKLEIPREHFIQRWAQKRTVMIWT